MAYTTIKKPSDYFNTVLYTANNSTQSITGVGFQPDFIWFKNRSSAYDHRACDSVRGANKLLGINITNAEATTTASVTSIDSDGFTLGADNDGYGVNYPNGDNIASWNWLAGGTGVSNTDGSITSTVSANTTSGFSIVKFTASGSGDETVGHGLGVKPKMVITKVTSTTGPWNTYNENLNSSAPEDYYLNLASTNGSSSDSPGVFGAGMTTSTIGVGVGVGFVSGQDYIAYCFAEKKGFSKFGSYTGNGNASDGTFVYTGFKPAFVIIKRYNASGHDWILIDNKRVGYNADNNTLLPNSSSAEDTGNRIDILSNGFKNYNANGSENENGGTYIYMAFAEEPLVGDNPATAR